MKRCCLSLGILFLFPFLSRADLVEYFYSGFAAYVGAGQSYTRSFSGLMIYDAATANVTFVSWGADKGYGLGTSTNFHYTRVSGPTTTQTLITHSASGIDSNNLYHLNNYMIRGVNTVLNIGSGKQLYFPAVLSGSNNRSITVDSNNNERLETWSETMTFAATKTQTDNNNHLVVDDVVVRVTTWLQNHGYHPR